MPRLIATTEPSAHLAVRYCSPFPTAGLLPCTHVGVDALHSKHCWAAGIDGCLLQAYYASQAI